jgi:hypothetical protein
MARWPARADVIAIGNGAGFWGDNLDAPIELVRSARLDVLTLEYLAELTLAILSHLRSKDPQAGYVTDFAELLERLVPYLNEQETLRVVTNAGGLNPRSCASKCATILARSGRRGDVMAVVSGDDVLDRIPQWVADGVELAHLETGEPIASVADRLVCANVYLGAQPIAESLAGGARIVVTGRVADASLTLGPACAAFSWAWDDWMRLAGASVAGHLIECGAQATGGLWHRWNEVVDLAGAGYPIAEVRPDGSSVITKPAGSGGLVTVPNVAEQLVYEIDDPARYRTPDVDVDLASVRLTQEGADRVGVYEARGQAPSDCLKLAAVCRDGWTASGLVGVVGRDAESKARAAGQIVLDRVRRAGFTLAESLVECLGAGDVVGGVVRPASEPFEVILRVSVRDPRREAVERFCKELAPLVTAGPPGIAGYATGRPSARPAFAFWPALVPRSLVEPRVDIRPTHAWERETGAAP